MQNHFIFTCTFNLFLDKLIISDPAEFHDRTFLTHLYQLPWQEALFTRRVEQLILTGKHMTFCRVSKEHMSVVCIHFEKYIFFYTSRGHLNFFFGSFSLRFFQNP